MTTTPCPACKSTRQSEGSRGRGGWCRIITLDPVSPDQRLVSSSVPAVESTLCRTIRSRTARWMTSSFPRNCSRHSTRFPPWWEPVVSTTNDPFPSHWSRPCPLTKPARAASWPATTRTPGRYGRVQRRILRSRSSTSWSAPPPTSCRSGSGRACPCRRSGRRSRSRRATHGCVCCHTRDRYR
jgi:hypothetical protein